MASNTLSHKFFPMEISTFLLEWCCTNLWGEIIAESGWWVSNIKISILLKKGWFSSEYPWNEMNITFTWLSSLHNSFKAVYRTYFNKCINRTYFNKCINLDDCRPIFWEFLTTSLYPAFFSLAVISIWTKNLPIEKKTFVFDSKHSWIDIQSNIFNGALMVEICFQGYTYSS